MLSCKKALIRVHELISLADKSVDATEDDDDRRRYTRWLESQQGYDINRLNRLVGKEQRDIIQIIVGKSIPDLEEGMNVSKEPSSYVDNKYQRGKGENNYSEPHVYLYDDKDFSIENIPDEGDMLTADLSISSEPNPNSEIVIYHDNCKDSMSLKFIEHRKCNVVDYLLDINVKHRWYAE